MNDFFHNYFAGDSFLDFDLNLKSPTIPNRVP